jgi:uncharacterized membrane protein
MGNNKLAFATLAGALTAFILGYALYGVLLVGFFAANAGTATGVMKEAPDLIPIALGQIPGALLLALIIQRWGGSKSMAGGAKVGAIFGLLITLSFDLTGYGSMNLSNLTATLVDPLVGTVLMAVVGAVIGMVLGRGETAAA